MSDELIDQLVADATPVRRRTLPLLLFAAAFVGAVLAALAMVPWIGLRPDLPAAFADPVFWMKFGFTLVLTLLGLGAAISLSRPAGRLRGSLAAMLGLVALTGAAGVAQLAGAPPEAWRNLVVGGTALVCPFYIVTLAAPVLIAVLLVMRRLAPTDLVRAGLAAGLLAGAAGAFVYAFHCGENGLPFLTLWYTAGIAAAGAIGALLGRVLLRW